jgi:hypothetical protein
MAAAPLLDLAGLNPAYLIAPERKFITGLTMLAHHVERNRMSLLARLFGQRPDDRAALHPLWHRIVEIAREREWYAQCGVADSVAGRFDTITLILGLVLLRMESEPALAEPSVRSATWWWASTSAS